MKGLESDEADLDGNGYVTYDELLEYINRQIKQKAPSQTPRKWGFDGPIGVAANSSGNVYVTDWRNDRIQKFTNDGKFITTWGSFGKGEGQFDSPSGVAVDSSGYVHVAEFDRIQKFTNDGKFITTWGSSGDGKGQLNSTAGVAVDSSGDVYVTEWNNDRVQVFRQGTPEGNLINKITVTASNQTGNPVQEALKNTFSNITSNQTGNPVQEALKNTFSNITENK